MSGASPASPVEADRALVLTDGIFGGLTDKERRSLSRSVRRGATAPADVEAKAARARQTQKPRTLQSLFDDNTVRLYGGHLAWTGPAKPSFRGREYTPKQLAFVLDRGRYAQGRVLVDCGVSECVLAQHIADDEERSGRAGARLEIAS